jgi:hypothetical protein
MMEFNPDGSLKIGGELARQKEEKENILKKEKSILIKKELVSSFSPKKCVLHITLSNRFENNGFVERVHSGFVNDSEVVTKLTKINEKEFEIEVGTCLRRCTDCNRLVGRFRGAMTGKIIEEKGSCT